MRLCIVFLGLIMVFLPACQEVTTAVDVDNRAIFFDLKDFFQKEKARLEKINSFKKTVSINGVSEEKTLTTLNFDNELSIFIASDINRPAWSDKYKVDSVFTAQKKLSQIKYTVLDESLKTKKVAIDFQNNAVANIEIEKATDNAVAQSKQTLSYHVGKGYAIKSEQALSLSDTKTILVQVEYQ
ncbi:MAG: hypothetical protein AB8G86_07255 [Saprospiraceae bacterium]